MNNNNKNEITLVIGDTLDITFELKSEYQIKEAYFVCSQLNVKQKLERFVSRDDWRLLVDNTEYFQSGIFDYDIKVIFIDDTLYTVSYRSLFKVLQNYNNLYRGYE